MKGSYDLGHCSFFCRDYGTSKHLRLIGRCIIPTDCTHRTIPYKYVVSKRGKKAQPKMQPDYEYIADGLHRGNVNRALIIPEYLKGKTTG